MRLAMVAAKFTDKEANGLRKAMATFRNVGTIHRFERLMVDGMVSRGYDRKFAEDSFKQIKGFGSYGFPESHAAAFAQLVYVSSWIKRYHPAAFAAALLNSQPMGFYAPAQIVRDAQKNGVEVRGPDVNFSEWDNTLERCKDGSLALRLGFRQIDGLKKDVLAPLTKRRGAGYNSIEDLWERSELDAGTLRLLADADSFRSNGVDRRQALWEVRRLPADKLLPLFHSFEVPELGVEPNTQLPEMPIGEHVVTDYQTIRLSLKAHPMEILRPVFAERRILSCADVASLPDGRWVRNAGVVLVRQRPGEGRAIFITLEDETGISNIIMWTRVFERFRREVMGSRLLMVEGRLQRSKDKVIHIMASRLHDMSSELLRLNDERFLDIDPSPGDEAGHLQYPRRRHSAASGDLQHKATSNHGHPRNVRILPKSRDFH